MIRLARYVTLTAVILMGVPRVFPVQPAAAQEDSEDGDVDDDTSQTDDGDDEVDPRIKLRERRLRQIDQFRNIKRPNTTPIRAGDDTGRGNGMQADPRETETPEVEDTSSEVVEDTPTPTPRPRSVNTKESRKLRSTDQVHFEFPDEADLEAVIKEISAITGRNFIYDKKDIRNHKITIIVETPISVAEAYQAFLSALEAAGLTTVVVGPKLVKIIPRRDAIQRSIDTRAGTSNLGYHAAFITRIIQLENISVQDAQQVVTSLVAKDGNATPFPPTNSFIITDSADNIRRIVKVMDELDRAGADMQIKVIQIKYADATQVAQMIEQLFGGSDSGQAARTPARRAIRRRTATKTPTTPTGESGLAISNVIPDERTNSLVVQASKGALESIMEVIAEVDVKLPDDVSNQRIHVYYLENANATDMATVLSSLSTGAGSNTRAQAPRRTGAVGDQRNQAGAGAPPPVADLLSGEVKVTADESTNSLVIVASASDYEVLKTVIRKLDIRRRQVFVEAVIADISIRRSREININLAVGADTGAGVLVGGLDPVPVLLPNPASLGAGLAMGLIGPQKIPFTFTDASGTQQTVMLPPFGVLLQALETDSDTNVLSRPTVLATENEEAEFISATSVAFQGSTTVSQTGLQNFAITREDVGITLRVTPKITESDYVTLEIFQEAKNIANDQVLANGQRLIDTAKRSAKTTVVAKHGQTVVLGGLISDEDIATERKVPLLGDIPFLGLFFRSETKTRTKSNLLIFLTPYIIRTEADMEQIYQQKWEERQMFLKLYANRSHRKDEKRKWTMYDRYYTNSKEPAEGEPKEEVPVVPVDEPRMTPPQDMEKAPENEPDYIGDQPDEQLYPEDGSTTDDSSGETTDTTDETEDSDQE